VQYFINGICRTLYGTNCGNSVLKHAGFESVLETAILTKA